MERPLADKAPVSDQGSRVRRARQSLEKASSGERLLEHPSADHLGGVCRGGRGTPHLPRLNEGPASSLQIASGNTEWQWCSRGAGAAVLCAERPRGGAGACSRRGAQAVTGATEGEARSGPSWRSDRTGCAALRGLASSQPSPRVKPPSLPLSHAPFPFLVLAHLCTSTSSTALTG